MNSNHQHRALWHNYYKRCIYMITLTKRKGVADFGTLEGDCSLPIGSPGCAAITPTSLGVIIRNSLFNISQFDSAVKLLQYIIMPDHVHFILFVQEPTETHIGTTIGRLKHQISKQWGSSVFDDGFNDQILKGSRKLHTIFEYLRSNPYRLAVRKAHPEYFARINRLMVADTQCMAYGNMFLLRNPFKEQIVVHRADSPLELTAKRERWLYTAANGGVLVSPFISQAEKALRDEAEACGGRFILITNKPFGPRYKPAAHDFELCASGRLLIISIPDLGSTLSRSVCLTMNKLAEVLSQT